MREGSGKKREWGRRRVRERDGNNNFGDHYDAGHNDRDIVQLCVCDDGIDRRDDGLSIDQVLLKTKTREAYTI